MTVKCVSIYILQALSSWWWSTSPSSPPLTWWRSTGITWERPGWPGTWRASYWCPRICRSQRHIPLDVYPFPRGCSAWFACHFWGLAEMVSWFLCNKNGKFSQKQKLCEMKTIPHSSFTIFEVTPTMSTPVVETR